MDLSAAKMTEFSDRVVAIGSEKILPVAAIYGANASGKSNIYNAFEYMSDYVVNSFKYGDEEEKFEETFNSLTNREKDVIVLAAKGASNREIADQLGIGQETVKMHCSNAYGKLGVRSRLEAYQWLQKVPGDVFKEKAL